MSAALLMLFGLSLGAMPELVILAVGLAYVWAKRDLEWIKPKPRIATLSTQKDSESGSKD